MPNKKTVLGLILIIAGGAYLVLKENAFDVQETQLGNQLTSIFNINSTPTIADKYESEINYASQMQKQCSEMRNKINYENDLFLKGKNVYKWTFVTSSANELSDDESSSNKKENVSFCEWEKVGILDRELTTTKNQEESETIVTVAWKKFREGEQICKYTDETGVVKKQCFNLIQSRIKKTRRFNDDPFRNYR